MSGFALLLTMIPTFDSAPVFWTYLLGAVLGVPTYVAARLLHLHDGLIVLSFLAALWCVPMCVLQWVIVQPWGRPGAV